MRIRTTLRSVVRPSTFATLAAFAALTAPLGCGSPASTDAQSGEGSKRDGTNGDGANGDGTNGDGTKPSSGQSADLIIGAPILANECVVATVTGTTTESVSLTILDGSSASLSLGPLNPGIITVNAQVFGAACPAAGPAIYASEAVQVNIVAGVTPQIPLVFRALETGSATATFSQPAVSIAAGMNTSFAVLADGTVRAWGSNGNAQFGAAGPDSPTPVVVPGVTSAVQIATNGYAACVVRSDSSVMCWGNTGLPTLQPVSGTQVSMSGSVITLLGTNGVVNASNQGVWTTVPSLGTCIAAATAGGKLAGYEYECGVTQDGIVECLWGGTTVVTEASPAVRVYGGMFQGCALLVNGTLSCWGGGGTIGPTTLTGAPQAIPGLQGVTAFAMNLLGDGVAGTGACAVAQGGTVYCTGLNASGQVGNDSNATATTFTQVPGLANMTQVAVGQAHTCALKNDGSVFCWGDNDNGQIGDGTTVTRFAPVPVTAF